MHQYSTAPSRGNCRSQSKRCPLWTSAKAFTGKLPSPIPTMEKWKNYRNSCCKAVWDATFYLPLSCEDLRKSQVVVSRCFYRNVYFSVGGNFALKSAILYWNERAFVVILMKAFSAYAIYRKVHIFTRECFGCEKDNSYRSML